MTLHQNAVSSFSQLKKKQKAVATFTQLLFQCHLAALCLRPTRAPRVGWLHCSICHSSHRKNLKPSSSRGLKCGPCSRLVGGNNPGSAGSSLLTAIQALETEGQASTREARETLPARPACQETAPACTHPLARVHVKRQTSGYGRKGGQFKRNLGETDKCIVKLYKPLLKKSVPHRFCEALMKTLGEDEADSGPCPPQAAPAAPRPGGLPRLQPRLPGAPSTPHSGARLTSALPSRRSNVISSLAGEYRWRVGYGQKGRLDQGLVARVRDRICTPGKRRPGGMPLQLFSTTARDTLQGLDSILPLNT